MDEQEVPLAEPERFARARMRLAQMRDLGVNVETISEKLSEAELNVGVDEMTAALALEEFFVLADELASKCTKFEETRIVTEGMIKSGSEDGADMSESSRLVAHAKEIYKEDIDEALLCIREAAEVSEGELKSLNKGLSVELDVLGARVDHWTSGWVTLRNLGLADLEEVEIEFGGACEVTGLSQVGTIAGKKYVKSPIRFKGKFHGDMPIKITIFYRNRFDGKAYSAHMMKWVSCK